MREIKIRLWGKKEKKMYYPERFSTATDDYEKMEFTGIIDKNGKEVYEGDITYDGQIIFCGKCHGWQCGFVDFHDNMVCHFCDGNFHINDIENLEVIGNVWENPELIEK